MSGSKCRSEVVGVGVGVGVVYESTVEVYRLGYACVRAWVAPSFIFCLHFLVSSSQDGLKPAWTPTSSRSSGRQRTYYEILCVACIRNPHAYCACVLAHSQDTEERAWTSHQQQEQWAATYLL